MAERRTFMGVDVRKPAKPSTPIAVLSVLVASALPIAQIVIGALHLKDCPRQDYIPVYLVVMGVAGLVLALLPLTQKAEDSGPAPLSRLCKVWNGLSAAFLFCWFICGNVWIYSIYEPNYNQTLSATEGPYCDRTLYLFAFWTTTLLYVLLALLLLGGCCALVCCLVLGVADADDHRHGARESAGP